MIHQVTGLHDRLYDSDRWSRKSPSSEAEISLSAQNASEEEKTLFEISPSGYGIHWPLLDEDLSIDGLLKRTHCSQAQETKLSSLIDKRC